MILLIMLGVHTLIITMYFVFRYYSQKIAKYTKTMMLPVETTSKYILMPIILVMLFGLQGFVNMYILSQRCNVDMMQSSFMIAGIVIFFIFGTIIGITEARNSDTRNSDTTSSDTDSRSLDRCTLTRPHTDRTRRFK